MTNLDQTRSELESARDALARRGDQWKDSQLVTAGLIELFSNLESGARALADQVLYEWLSSDDESKRFDAVAIVDALHIVMAIPALENLERRLRSSSAPGAPFEAKKVERTIAGLRDR